MDTTTAGTDSRLHVYKAFIIIFSIVLLDQLLKVYIKTHYAYGESHSIIGKRVRLYFIENDGMAWGWKLKGSLGKILLTLFRMAAVIWGTLFIPRFIRRGAGTGMIVCVCLIYAGAFGNLIDSVFYGVVFDRGAWFNPAIREMVSYDGVARLSGKGYARLLHGNVVDMIYCPIISGHFFSWLPFVGGKPFHFFNMIFNVADASISVGITILVLFYNIFTGRPTARQVGENSGNSI